MKILVNNIEVKNLNDLENAMNWENQEGTYANIKYICENNNDWKNIKIKPLLDNIDKAIFEEKFENNYVKFVQIGCEYHISNWYSSIKPYINDNGKKAFMYDKFLSIKNNAKYVFELLKEDGVI